MTAVHLQEAAAERILVLDDDPEICELTQAYLQQQGFIVDTVQSGEALDAYLEEHSVDLLVLDLMLPGEHGLTIAQRMKKRMDLPIIIISAQGDDVDRIVGLELGADAIWLSLSIQESCWRASEQYCAAWERRQTRHPICLLR